jgi:23S rRNA-/tRNA-specific pseudouridylate synthase
MMVKERNNLHVLRILCVGDGDLSFSLSLIRAYGRQVLDVTTSTLLNSSDELIETYPNSAEILKELKENDVEILFGIDATQLSTFDAIAAKKFDWVLFSHPHLGMDSLQGDNETLHARRHFHLLTHYFWSARQLNIPNIHVCLCGRQDTTWRLMDAASRANIECIGTYVTSLPPHSTWLKAESGVSMEPLPVQSHYPAPRRFRNGRLGSKHFLGKYGYRHQWTHSKATSTSYKKASPNVENSQHFIFQTIAEKSRVIPESIYETPEAHLKLRCAICDDLFASETELESHLRNPALPNDLNESTTEPSRKKPKNKITALNISRTEDFSALDGNSENKHTISEEDSGKRIRRYLQLLLTLSKKKVEELISQGSILIHQRVVCDSSRILCTGDVVEIRSLANHMSRTQQQFENVKLVHRERDEWVVAMKPVGMRAAGIFSQNTLESVISCQLGHPHILLSKLDTGCSGLCVLTRRKEQNPTFPSIGSSWEITSVFTALVHGRVTWKDQTVTIPIDSSRRWRSTKPGANDPKICHESKSIDHIAQEIDIHVPHKMDDNSEVILEKLECKLHITCTEQTSNEGSWEFSTLQIREMDVTSGSRVRVESICYALRNILYHPVVNDRYCRPEYLQGIPRSVQNLLKTKLCIGCFEVIVVSSSGSSSMTRSVQVPSPERWNATFWDEHRKRQFNANESTSNPDKGNRDEIGKLQEIKS